MEGLVAASEIDAKRLQLLLRSVSNSNGPPVRVVPVVKRIRKTMKAGFPVWLMWGTLAVAFYLLIVQMTPDYNLEPAVRPAATPR